MYLHPCCSESYVENGSKNEGTKVLKIKRSLTILFFTRFSKLKYQDFLGHKELK
jgi:hypothetical protein